MDREEHPALDDAGMALAKSVRQRLRDVVAAAKESPDDATYLWLYVTRAGIGQAEGQPLASPMSEEAWLAIIDEAASIGVNWLVITVHGRLNIHPEIFSLCRWAQETHGMKVGLHTFCETLLEDEIASLRGLRADMTRLLVNRDRVAAMRAVEAAGIKVCPAEPDAEDLEHASPCTKPGKMVYVNSDGHLYTCGMVDGEADYHLGDAQCDSMRQVVRNPKRPVAVPLEHAKKLNGCDGCPPIVVRRFG